MPAVYSRHAMRTETIEVPDFAQAIIDSGDFSFEDIRTGRREFVVHAKAQGYRVNVRDNIYTVAPSIAGASSGDGDIMRRDPRLSIYIITPPQVGRYERTDSAERQRQAIFHDTVNLG